MNNLDGALKIVHIEQLLDTLRATLSHFQVDIFVAPHFNKKQ
jgi:hypothetical protein